MSFIDAATRVGFRTSERPEGRFARTVAADFSNDPTIQPPTEGKHFAEMQSAPRFPLQLAVSLKSQDGAQTAETRNISANGRRVHGGLHDRVAGRRRRLIERCADRLPRPCGAQFRGEWPPRRGRSDR